MSTSLSPFESGPSFVMLASVLTLELVLLAWIGMTTTAAHASTATSQRRLIDYPLEELMRSPCAPPGRLYDRAGGRLRAGREGASEPRRSLADPLRRGARPSAQCDPGRRSSSGRAEPAWRAR